jgi:hypothetical protein
MAEMSATVSLARAAFWHLYYYAAAVVIRAPLPFCNNFLSHLSDLPSLSINQACTTEPAKMLCTTPQKECTIERITLYMQIN